MVRRARRLSAADRSALELWLLTRMGVAVVATAAAAVLVRGNLQEPFLDRWTQWDVDLLIEIARFGYEGDPSEGPDPGLPAFFPGFPLLLRAVHVVVPDWRIAALLISLVAGAVAMVALARLGDHEGPPGTGVRAVAALLLSPMAVFLFAGYSEALFLACALPAWLLARQGRWELAALCGLAAGLVRITGLFLAVALVVLFLTRRPIAWRKLPHLAVPFLGPAGYLAYQWWRTGDMRAWQTAQERGWGRSLVPPWESFQTTWHSAFGLDNDFTVAFRVELVAAAIGVLLTGWLLARRRWAESTYLGLQLAALLGSAFYLSIGRATLLWWPLWLAIGVLGVRRPRTYLALLALSVPLLVLQVVTFTSGGWTG
ncbi:hypothetical protein DPM19_13430 [Actinomadura craniellae]|uniref:Glycosyltransferase RgtA/B/C/D-like domain-containing protein n=1 Tax=Actinomadura craniellae TaxID=2231787 RepID=A0A365H748_9ACTN|nr:hypothetical protein DPM19_13430 [Actinomadura craniellae]